MRTGTGECHNYEGMGALLLATGQATMIYPTKRSAATAATCAALGSRLPEKEEVLETSYL